MTRREAIDDAADRLTGMLLDGWVVFDKVGTERVKYLREQAVKVRKIVAEVYDRAAEPADDTIPLRKAEGGR